MQHLFAQLTMTFNKGVKDYEGQLRSNVDKQIAPVVKEFKDVLNKNKVSQDLERKLANVIKNEIKNLQISGAPAGDAPGASNPASHPATPNPAMSVAETQASIRNLLQEGKFNEAFLMALNANNLMVVVATCEMVNIKIFDQTPCPLSEEVLLSLIQQLGKYYIFIDFEIPLLILETCPMSLVLRRTSYIYSNLSYCELSQKFKILSLGLL